MFGCVDSQACMNNSSKPSKEKNLILSFSLLMRVFEWCHEDAKDDVEMHRVMEKLVSFNDGVNPLTIDVYDCLIADSQKDCCSTNHDLQMAYDLGQEYAENGDKLSCDGRDYSIIAGEIISNEKDNGYGASNSELEQFWKGYENTTPVQNGCWAEMDANTSIDREKPMTISFGNDVECCEPCEETIDSDLMSQIQSIINMGKL